MIRYKLTDAQARTRNGMQWSVGQTCKATGDGTDLCSDGFICVYDTPEQAAFMRRVHVPTYCRLWEVECPDEGITDGTKRGVKAATPIREIPLPEIKLTHQVEIGIRCAMTVYKGTNWTAWADRWLDGSDRTNASAAKAASYADACAAKAASYADACAAKAASYAAAYAADAAEADACAAAAYAAVAYAAKAADYAAQADAANAATNTVAYATALAYTVAACATANAATYAAAAAEADAIEAAYAAAYTAAAVAAAYTYAAYTAAYTAAYAATANAAKGAVLPLCDIITAVVRKGASR